MLLGGNFSRRLLSRQAKSGLLIFLTISIIVGQFTLARGSTFPTSDSLLSGLSYVQDEIIIKLDSKTNASERNDILSSVNAIETRKLSFIGAEVVKISGMTVEDAVDLLKGDSRLQFAEPNYIWQANLISNDPYFNNLWGMNNTGQTGGTIDADIDAVEAWDVGTGDTIIIGVIDTGVDTAHPDLHDNLWTNPGEIPDNGLDDDGNGYADDIHGWDFVNNDNGPIDDFGHGSHCSGTIAARGNNAIGVAGVCWSAKIMALKFLNSSGYGTTDNAILAIQYATMMGANLTSNSWGGGSYSASLKEAIDSSNAHGMLFVAAAGNGKNDNDLNPSYPASYPSDNIIAVAATDHNDHLADEGYWGSNWGLTTVDLGAPGVNIYSTIPGGGYEYYSGTSMATPHVSGAAALVWSLYPSLTNLQVKERLMIAVDTLPDLMGKCVTGGRLNIFKAIAGPDSIPPSAIADLSVIRTEGTRITLSWTATGDDSTVGRASRYDLRYAQFPIDESNFDMANQVVGEPYPQESGLAESCIVRQLNFSTEYYFAIKAFDEWNNASAVSNNPSGMTLGPSDIMIEPNILIDSLFSNGISTQLLNIADLAEGELFYGIEIEYPSKRAKSGEITVPASMPYLKGEIARSPVPPANNPQRKINITGEKISSRSLRVLLIYADWGASTINGILSSYPDISYVDLWYAGSNGSGSIPPLSKLMNYDVVVAWNNEQWNDQYAIGNVLADYMDAGGAVITMVDCWSAGAFASYGRYFESDGYAPFRSLGGAMFDSRTLGWYDEDHRIMDSVSYLAINDFYNNVALTNGAIEIAQWDDGTPLVAINPRTVSINIWPGDGNVWSGDFPTLIHNAINYVAGSINWLSAVPDSGEVAPFSNTNINVNFNASGLNGGNYNADLMVFSNDPDQSVDTVDVLLHVTGAPDISIKPDSIDYGFVYVGYPKALLIEVSNRGTDTLKVTDIYSDNLDFSADASNLQIPPSQKDTVQVSFSPSTSGHMAGNLHFISNDPDETELAVHLQGEGLICPEIWTNPSGLAESLFTGEMSSQTLTIGNSNGSMLNLSASFDNYLGPNLIAKSGDNKKAAGSGIFINNLIGTQGQKNTAYDPNSKTTRDMYINNQDGFSALGGIPGEIIASWPAPSPIQMAWGTGFDGHDVWISDALGLTDNKISDEGVLLHWFSCSSWVGVWGGDLDWDGQFIWQVNVGGDNGIYQLDPVSGDVINSIHDPSGIWDAISERGLAYNRKEDVFFVGGWNTGMIYKIKGLSWDNPGEIIGSFTFYDVSGLAYHPGGTLWVVTNSDVDHVFQVDPNNGAVLSYFSLPGPAYGYCGAGLAIDRKGNLWCPNQGNNTVYLVNSGVPAFDWVQIAPTSDSIQPGSSTGFNVAFDASGLYGGEYSADLLIESNDCDQPNLVLPISLHVTGAPDIAFSKDSINYGSLFIGLSKADTLIISNEGTDLLTVSNLSSDNPNYVVNIANFNLAPEEKRSVLVSFAPTTATTIEGKLTISSNDPDQPEYTIFLKGTGLVPPDISVIPDSLDADLFTGQQTTQKLTISNSGGSDLIYKINFENADYGDSLSAKKPIPDRSLILGPGVSINKVDSSRNSYDESHSKIEAPVIKMPRSSKETSVLVFRDWLPWGYDVNVPLLQYFGASVTTATSYEMAAIDLSLFDLIVFESQQPYQFYSVYMANLGRFEAFLNSGGVIEFHCATWSSDRIPNLPFPGGMRTLSAEDLDYYNYIADYSHPIVAGAIEPFSGDFASHEALENIPAGADIIVSNESGLPTTVEYSYGMGTIIVTGMTWEIGYALGWSSAIPLLPNALQYSLGLASGPSWLIADLPTGVVPVESSLDINITFDAAGLYGGDYLANIMFINNDPDESLLAIPAHLHVTGAPDIAFSKDSINYGNLFISLSKTDTLIISNEGTDLLTVSNLSSDNPNYVINIANFNLAPEESQPVLVTFTPTTATIIEGKLTINSNDPDQPEHTIPFTGTGLIPPIISAAPDSFFADLFTGDTTTQTLTISNSSINGASDLTYKIRARKNDSLLVLTRQCLEGITGSGTKITHDNSNIITFNQTELELFKSKLDIYNKNSRQLAGRQELPEIAVVGSDPYYMIYLLMSDSGLAGNYLFYAIYDYSNYPQIEAYDGVIVAEYDYSISYEEALSLSAYSNSGRPIILGMDDLDDEPLSVKDILFPVFGIQATYDGGYFWGALNPDNPITEGLTTVYSYYDGDNDWYLPSAASWIYAGDDGHYYGVSNESQNRTVLMGEYLGAIWSYGNSHLIANGINWMMGKTRWLSIVTDTGTVSVGNSAGHDVIFDAEGLYGGNYYADVVIESNDPVTPEVAIPAHLHVTGAPDIAFSKDSINYGNLFIGLSKTDTLIISNEGTDLLSISGLSSDNPNYSVNITSFDLAPRENQPVLVTFAPTTAAIIEGKLTINSNDPDQPEYTLTLTGTGLIPPEISVTPDSLDADLFTGQQVTQKLIVSNSGGSDLLFDISVEGWDKSAVSVAVNRQSGELKSFNVDKKITARSLSDTLSHNQHGNSELGPDGVIKGRTVTPNVMKHDNRFAGEVLRTIPAPGNLLGLTYFDKSLWAVVYTGQSQEKIMRLDPANGNVLDSFDLDYNYYLGLTNDGDNLWVGSFTSGAVSKYSKTGELLDSWYPPITPQGLAWDGEALWVGASNSLSLYRMDISGNILETRQLPYGSIGYLMDMEWVPQHTPCNLWIVDADYYRASQFDLTTDPAIFCQDFPSPSYSYPTEGIAHDGKNLWISSFYDSVIYQVDDGIVDISWLSAAPEQGIVPVDDSVEITVTFDASGLYGGDYNGRIVIANNDPDESEIVLPAHLHVTGAPDIAVSTDTLNYGTLFMGLTAYDTIIVKNEGTDLLTVTDISSDNPVFVPSPKSFNLSPGKSQAVLVTFTPVDSGYVEAKISIVSNDQDESEITVFAYGVGLYPPDIAVTPDSLTEYLYPNQIKVDTITISNTGLSDLIYNITASEQKATSSGLTGKNIQLRTLGTKNLTYSSDLKDSKLQNKMTEPSSYGFPIASDSSRATTSPDGLPVGVGQRPPEIRAAILPYFDGFEDGNFDGWSSFGNYNGINEVTDSTAAEGRYSYHNLDYSDGCMGIIQYFEPGSRPNYIGFFTRFSSIDKHSGYFSTGSNSYGLWEAIWFYAGADGKLHINSYSGGDNSVAYLANRWYHIEFRNIDWSAKSFDYYVDESLIMKDIPFANGEHIEDISYLELYNCSANAETWCDGIECADIRFLTIQPSFGTVHAGSSADIEVTFNTTDLAPGDYYADINIHSNDPDEPLLAIPAYMHLIGAPDIEISKDSINFGDVPIGIIATDSLIITNAGTETLSVSSMTSNNPYFVPDTTSFILAPGANLGVRVAFTPTEEGPQEGRLTILSNDPDEDSITMRLSGFGYIPARISVTPDSMGAILTSGQTQTRTLTISNTGGRESAFRISILGANIIDSNVALSRPIWEQDGKLEKIKTDYTLAFSPKPGSINEDINRSGAHPDHTSQSNPSRHITASAGNVLRTIPAPGKTLGLTYMHGSLWAVVDTIGGERIVELDPDDGAIISSFSIGYALHLGLANDGNNLWVCEGPAGMVKKYSPQGDLLKWWNAPIGDKLRGIAWDGSSLWIGGSDCGYLIRTDTNGNVLESRELASSQIGWGMDMEWVPDHINGELWIIDDWSSNDINQFNARVDPIALLQDFQHPAPQLTPEGIAHDGENLWVSAYQSSELYLVDDGLKELCWLIADPISGIIAPGESKEITITYDASGLGEGEYNAEIKILNDDPLNKIITIPADLKIVSALLCGYVKDTLDNPIPGTTIEIWDNFPNGTLLKILITDSSGAFACDSVNSYSFDVYAYCSGYYPAIAEDIEINDYGFEMTLTPLPHLIPTTEATFFYCGDNTYFGAPVPIGSVIDAYDPDGILCGSWYVTVPGRYGLMPVYRDDFSTPNRDEGAEPGDELKFFVNGMPAMTSARPIWTENGDRHEICLSITEMQEQQIVLSEGWNLVSWHLDTPEDGIETILGPVMECVKIVLGFDQGGLVYDPDLPQFSTLLNVDHLHGYWIKMNCERTLTITGKPIPTSTPIDLETGWNLISYLPESADSIPGALGSVLDNLIVVLGFNHGGLTYDPNLPQFSTLKIMEPGYGYWLKTASDDTLIYPGAGLIVTRPRNSSELLHAKIDSRMTPSNTWVNLFSRHLTLDGKTVESGTEILAILSDGTVCGIGAVGENGQFGYMPVYGNDPTTSKKEGPIAGESFRLMIAEKLSYETIKWSEFGDITEIKALNSRAIAEILPTEYSLDQNYPNPFNPSTEISFSLPVVSDVTLEIFNVAGQKIVSLINKKMPAGRHTVQWNGRDNDRQELASGIYFYRLRAGDFADAKKMILMK